VPLSSTSGPTFRLKSSNASLFFIKSTLMISSCLTSYKAISPLRDVIRIDPCEYCGKYDTSGREFLSSMPPISPSCPLFRALKKPASSTLLSIKTYFLFLLSRS
jgi:hypothetical protein